jgi:hypothetical protein
MVWMELYMGFGSLTLAVDCCKGVHSVTRVQLTSKSETPTGATTEHHVCRNRES